MTSPAMRAVSARNVGCRFHSRLPHLVSDALLSARQSAARRRDQSERSGLADAHPAGCELSVVIAAVRDVGINTAAAVIAVWRRIVTIPAIPAWIVARSVARRRFIRIAAIVRTIVRFALVAADPVAVAVGTARGARIDLGVLVIVDRAVHENLAKVRPTAAVAVSNKQSLERPEVVAAGERHGAVPMRLPTIHARRSRREVKILIERTWHTVRTERIDEQRVFVEYADEIPPDGRHG